VYLTHYSAAALPQKWVCPQAGLADGCFGRAAGSAARRRRACKARGKRQHGAAFSKSEPREPSLRRSMRWRQKSDVRSGGAGDDAMWVTACDRGPYSVEVIMTVLSKQARGLRPSDRRGGVSGEEECRVRGTWRVDAAQGV
jgi:hypothetical protein